MVTTVNFMVNFSTIIHASYSCVAVCFITVSNELRKEFEGRKICLVHDFREFSSLFSGPIFWAKATVVVAGVCGKGPE